MTEVRSWWQRYRVRVAIGLLTVCAIATPINIALAVTAFSRTGRQAQEGADAKARQNRVFPINCKITIDAHVRGVITDADLARYETPRHCPRPTP